MLYSVGKDSSVLLHLLAEGVRAGAAADPAAARRHRLEVPRDDRVPRPPRRRDRRASCSCTPTPRGVAQGINPITHGATVHTDVMKTQALKQALDRGASTPRSAAPAATRSARAPRSASSRSRSQHRWDPKNQRPELWNLYNTRIHKGESVRVFPLSNWTELDVWLYIYRENIPVPSLYFAAERPVVERDGALIMVDDERLPLPPARCACGGSASAPSAATR
jgi:sulfate adenylyltransferase subunit 2